MEKEQLFKWKHFQPEIILLTVRWYLRYNLSFRNLVEMMVITVDKNPADSIVIDQLKKEKSIPDDMQIRQQKYQNNIVDQDHRFIKKRVCSMLGLKTFRTAKQIICGMEVMHMLKKDNFNKG